MGRDPLFRSAVLAVAVLALAACASSPPDAFFSGGGGGTAARGGDADGRSSNVTPAAALASGAASDATALVAEWSRQATVPVAGDTYQLVLGDASFLPADVVEEGYRARLDAAIAAAEKAPSPAADASIDAALEKLRAYRESRVSRLVSTGHPAPQVVIFSGSKIVHGTTSQDLPSAEVARAVGDVGKALADQVRAAKGTPPPAAPPAEGGAR